MLQDREPDEAAKKAGDDTEVVFTERVSVPGVSVGSDGTTNQLEITGVEAPTPAEGQAVVIENSPATTPMPVPVVAAASTANGDGNARQENSPTEDVAQQDLARMSPTDNATNGMDPDTCKRMRLNDELVSTSPLSELLKRTSQRSATNSPRSSPSASMLPMQNIVFGSKQPDGTDDIAEIEATKQRAVVSLGAVNGDKRVICID